MSGLSSDERRRLLALLTRPQPNLIGLHTKGMSKSRAKAYLAALCNRSDQAEAEQADTKGET